MRNSSPPFAKELRGRVTHCGVCLPARGAGAALERLAGPLPSGDFLLSKALVSYVFAHEHCKQGCVLGVCLGCLELAYSFVDLVVVISPGCSIDMKQPFAKNFSIPKAYVKEILLIAGKI